MAINLPIPPSGTILGAQLGATQTSTTGANGTEYTTTPSEVQASDRLTTDIAMSSIPEGTIFIEDMDSGNSNVNPIGPVGFILSLTAGGAQ